MDSQNDDSHQSTSKQLSKAFKEGSLFSRPNDIKGGTGYAPNADRVQAHDNTDELQMIAEGADPEAVQKIAEEKQKAQSYNPLEYENRRSQSVIYSQREITEQQLADVRARNEAALRTQQRIQVEEKAKRASFKVGVGIFIAVLVILGVALVFVVITSIRRTVPRPEDTPTESDKPLSTVDGYKCETHVCSRITSLPDGRIILRDTAYYIYDTKTQERKSTTIDAQDYNEVFSFVWGDKTYLTLDPNSAQTALFSVSENRYITRYDYDQYFTDINDKIYSEMRQVKGAYIIAKVGSTYKLINITSGQAVARGSRRIFTNSGFYFGYENDGRIYVYSNAGKTITVLQQDVKNGIFTRNNFLIIIKDESDFRIYNQKGEEVAENPIYDEVFDGGDNNYMNYVLKHNSFYRIPLNN